MGKAYPLAIGVLAAFAALSSSAAVVTEATAEAEAFQLFGRNTVVRTRLVTYSDGNLTRVDTTSPEQNTSLIYRADKREIINLDHRKKSYTVFGEAQAKEFRKIAERLNQDVKSRRGTEALISGIAHMTIPERYEPAGGSVSAMGKPCKKFYGMRGTKRISEVCVIPITLFSTARMAAKASMRNSELFRQMFPAEMLRQMSDQLVDRELLKIGYPVDVKMKLFGKLSSRVQTTSMQYRWSIDPKLFEVPPDYRKT